MEENKTKKEENKRLSYEELNDVCKQLHNQNEILIRKVQEMNLTNAFKRLDYLFSVLNAGEYFPKEFKDKVVDEVENILYSQEAPEENK